VAFSTQALVIGLSLFLHVAVVGLGLMQWSHSRPLHVRLDQPVAYQVDLVRLEPPAPGPAKSATTAPAPQAEPEAPKEPKPAPAPAKAAPIPAPKPKAAVEIPEQPKPKPTPAPAKPAPKPEPEPEPAKPKPPKAAPKQPAKPARKPEPTREQILAEALGAAQQDVSSRASDEREQALASLRQGAAAQENGGGGASEGRAAGGLVAVYAQMVEAQIKAQWRYPQAGARQNLVAMVEIQLDRNGRVLGTRVVRSSGRSDFDASAERAVEETGQLPAPPRDDLRRIQITFNLQEL